METTVLPCISASYSFSNQSKRPERYQPVPFMSRVLQAIHKCNEEPFEPIRSYSPRGLSVRTNCGAMLRCHFVISSYTADIPESKDLLSVNHAVLNLLPFPCCFTLKYDIDQHYQYRFRTVEAALPILSAFHYPKMQVLAQNMAERISVHTVKPIFSDFSFVGSDLHNNIFSFFYF